ncbi:MAG TPA: TetR/AcrR family transcriptional regulator [Euzebya sp.]|nr:TetR/AcrR family transcriptional regulator [Euzebya sp.]
MPTLWRDTIEAHRQAVRQAILETTWALVTEHGLLSVTMSRIAEEAGVGRATLYKYFPDVQSILAAWHERQTTEHLAQLTELANRGGDTTERLHAVLEGYAGIAHHRGSHAPELAAVLHKGAPVRRAAQQLVALIRDLLAAAAAQGQVRDDVPPDELASYCVHALATASDLPSTAAVERLLKVTLDGLRRRH